MVSRRDFRGVELLLGCSTFGGISVERLLNVQERSKVSCSTVFLLNLVVTDTIPVHGAMDHDEY